MEYTIPTIDFRFRCRDINMTEVDMIAFLDALSAAFPGARYLNWLNPDFGSFLEISLTDAAWNAVTRYDVEREIDLALNLPALLFRAWSGGRIQRIELPECNRTIRVCREGRFQAHFEVDNAAEKRMVDKIQRIQRKQIDNRAQVFDLKTGELVREDTCSYWYGRDMARRSLEEEDLFVQIHFDRKNGNFWGYKATSD